MIEPFLKHLQQCGCFEEHPNFDSWFDLFLKEIMEAMDAGFERHGDSFYDGIEGLVNQCRRKIGDMQTYVFSTPYEQAKLGFSNEDSDGLLSVSRDLAVYALLQYGMVWANEWLDKHPEEIDVAEGIRRSGELEILKKYESCLRGNHQLAEEDSPSCVRCGIEF